MPFKKRVKFFLEEVKLWLEMLLPNVLAIMMLLIIGLVMAVIIAGLGTLLVSMIGGV